MDFTTSQTFSNLARSFAGEAQAGLRYQFIAKTAESEGYKILSDTIRSLAKNETNHAKVFFEKIKELAGNQPNINVDGGYPFESGTLEDGLKFAVKGETEEYSRIYPQFMQIALEEGYKDVANIYKLVAEVEKQHSIIFEFLYNAFKQGKLYKNDGPMLWRCSACGYQQTTKEAFTVCPLCKASQGYVELHLPFRKEK